MAQVFPGRNRQPFHENDHPEAILQIGYDLNAGARSSGKFLMTFVVHLFFVTSVLGIALSDDGEVVEWWVRFVPLISSISIVCFWLMADLCRQGTTMEERALLLESSSAFVLVLGIASAVLASLAARGIYITPGEEQGRSIPSVNVSLGTFQIKWKLNSEQLGSDMTVFLRGVKISDTQERLEDWIGVNVSSSQMTPVYNRVFFDQVCFARLDTQQLTNCETSYAELPKEICSFVDLLADTTLQTCNQEGKEGAECLNFVLGQTPYDSLTQRSIATTLRNDFRADVQGLCSDTCQYSNDGVCDDGGRGASYSVCNFGEDCSDCGTRDWHVFARDNSDYFPTCGYFVAQDDVEKQFPQRYTVPWLLEKRTAKCANVCDEHTSLGESHTWTFWNETGGVQRCCDSEKVIPSEIIHVPTGATIGTCIQKCLAKYYYDQESCSMIQHNPKLGKCERLEFRDRLCTKTDEGLNCSSMLTFSGSSFGWNKDVVPRPISASRTLKSEVRDPWEHVLTAPKKDTWVVDDADWNIHVLLSHGFLGSAPVSLMANMDLQIIISPFICVPIALGMFVVCVCCTPLSCLPETRITHEDVCAWDYFVFRGSPHVHAQLQNFRLLLMIFSLSLATILLVFQKVVLDDGRYSKEAERLDSNANSLAWPIVFIPLYIVATLICFSTIGLVRRSRLVLLDTWSRYGNGSIGHRDSNFRISSERAQFLLRATLACLVFYLPCALSTIALSARLELCAEDSKPTWCPSALLVSFPVAFGLVLHMLFLCLFFTVSGRVMLYTWKTARLEALELCVRASLRSQRAAGITKLKERFLCNDVSSTELISILQTFAFRGRECQVTHEEVKSLGRSKLALLEAAGLLHDAWTPEVAREFGEILRYLLAEADLPCGGRQLNQKRLRMEDMGMPRGFRGTCLLIFRPGFVQSCMLKLLRTRDSDPKDSEFNKFLEEKSRFSSFSLASMNGGNVQPPEEQLLSTIV